MTNPVAPPSVVLVLSTLPDAEVAAGLARTLVEEGAVACVNLVPQVRSIYRWEGSVQDEVEVLAIAKTTAAQAPALVARIAALHPYATPEILVVPVVGGNPAYLAWVAASVG